MGSGLGDEWLKENSDNFWNTVASQDSHKVIWIGDGSAKDQAGYLAYLGRIDDPSAEVIRPSAYFEPHWKYGPPSSVGVLNKEQLANCLENCPRRPVSEDAALKPRWRELQSEAALLRILDGGRLVSAPLDTYDRFVISGASSEWTRGVRVVGNALANAFDHHQQEPQQQDHIVEPCRGTDVRLYG